MPRPAKGVLKLPFDPGTITLKTVKDRNGNSYPPPKTHLDKPIEPRTALRAAELTYIYLKNAITEAEKKFGTSANTKGKP